jgi:hypothetical protein
VTIPAPISPSATRIRSTSSPEHLRTAARAPNGERQLSSHFFRYAVLRCFDSRIRYRPHRRLISFVADRPGHDRRYAMDIGKIRRELGWEPAENFDSGLRKTVSWYLENHWWWEPTWSQRYRGARLGTSGDRDTEKPPLSTSPPTLGG